MIASVSAASCQYAHQCSGSLPFTGGHDISVAVIGMVVLMVGVILATQVRERRG